MIKFPVFVIMHELQGSIEGVCIHHVESIMKKFNQTLWYYIGMSQAALGDTADAIESLNKFTANSADSVRVGSAIQKIEQLGGDEK